MKNHMFLIPKKAGMTAVEAIIKRMPPTRMRTPFVKPCSPEETFWYSTKAL